MANLSSSSYAACNFVSVTEDAHWLHSYWRWIRICIKDLLGSRDTSYNDHSHRIYQQEKPWKLVSNFRFVWYRIDYIFVIVQSWNCISNCCFEQKSWKLFERSLTYNNFVLNRTRLICIDQRKNVKSILNLFVFSRRILTIRIITQCPMKFQTTLWYLFGNKQWFTSSAIRKLLLERATNKSNIELLKYQSSGKREKSSGKWNYLRIILINFLRKSQNAQTKISVLIRTLLRLINIRSSRKFILVFIFTI